MATLDDRPFSKDYSGLINQSVIAGCFAVIFLSAQEVMKRRRRGKKIPSGLGSVESWEFGYLYQGRSWAKNPSPPVPLDYPLAWVKQVIQFPEPKLNDLRGLDATIYVRFLRGCAWFTLLHTFTTVPILLPIHLHFSRSDVSPRSMTRASISSLVTTEKGVSLLWVHIVILFYVTITWTITLYWICRGAFKYRNENIQATERRIASSTQEEKDLQYNPHPHPQYPFLAVRPLEHATKNRGFRLRTVMVTNLPLSLRTTAELREYFQYYLSRSTPRPTMAIVPTNQPGFLNKLAGYIFNRAKELPRHIPQIHPARDSSLPLEEGQRATPTPTDVPVIEDVVIARKMTELASLLERREEVMKRLETAHIKLARRVLTAVREEMDRREGKVPMMKKVATQITNNFLSRSASQPSDRQASDPEDADMNLLVHELRPFVEEFEVQAASHVTQRRLWSLPTWWPEMCSQKQNQTYTTLSEAPGKKTLWEVLLTLPRQTLDPYQPLIHLSVVFRDKTVPAIDYYTAKLGLLTSLITENRAKQPTDYDPVSTAFVTFAEPKDALRACQVLAAHPNNVLSCFVTMAPGFEDLDWTRIMKSSYRVEFIKDWVVDIGVWAFTLFWLFPLSLFVGLVSIQNISAYWPGLAHYLEKHNWEEELIQSFLPTILVALLMLLIPVLLLLIAKKAHTITTLSALHDRIMMRYHKFLIVNILVFFCVGTAALQSLLVSFASSKGGGGGENILEIVATSFPSAGPFYVGWLIFTTGIHASIELLLCEWNPDIRSILPLITYLPTRRQVTPRKRAVGIRPRTFNYYYWLPNHMLILYVILVFSILNPLVVPFGFVYFMVASTVIKNQLLHVYAKNYEGNGKTILIRLIRYSLDGLILTQAVFLAYMAVLKNKVNVALSAVLIIFTVFTKVTTTRMCRIRFDRDDITEANIVCGNSDDVSGEQTVPDVVEDRGAQPKSTTSRLWRTWRLSSRFIFSYATFPPRHQRNDRQPNPFSRPETSLASDRDDEPEQCSSSSSSSEALSPNDKYKMDQIPDLQPVQAQAPVQPSPSSPQPQRPVSFPAPNPNLPGSSTLVATPHPPHPAWDDEPDYNHPYENPYYTQEVSPFLWLPRNPCGLLDLDDTVDVRRSLTTTDSAGELGSWQLPPLPLPSPALPGSPPASPEIDRLSYSQRGFSGTEDFPLPPRIAARVDDPNEVDDDAELGHRPSHFRRRKMSARSTVGTARTSYSSRQPYTLDGGSHVSVLSGRRPWMKSTFSLRRQPSFDAEMAVRPDAHAQTALPNPSMLTVAGHRAETTSVTMQEALVEEVLVEEHEAAQERLREEAMLAQQSMRTRRWWSKWMFTEHGKP
ncbi:hypothetical protein OF83DRAFT_1224915 [Amylostereum chailletii]|nr:hypothetical protein OF83DRAFT_1224915 [Amylostereum chailletii]